MTRLALALLALSLLAGCSSEERTPDGTVRRLIQLIDEGNLSEVYRLLAPDSQRALIERARIANAQTGGGQRFKPEDLLAIGQVPARHDLGGVKTVREAGDSATVQLQSKRGAREDLELRKVDGRWRVVMPAEKDETPPAGKTPTTGKGG
jgi:hypothetical protein